VDLMVSDAIAGLQSPKSTTDLQARSVELAMEKRRTMIFLDF
jgi:hypothetical protein